MSNATLSRRDFLKLAALASAGAAFAPLPDKILDLEAGNLGRVATRQLSVYAKPDDQSEIRYQRYRDDLINLYYPEESEFGPTWNPLWYRVWGGYIHSAHLQKVDYRLNTNITAFPEERTLGQICVPYTQSLMRLPKGQWKPTYRLYYHSLHWIMGLEEGPDGLPWYRLQDELLEVDYLIPAEHIEPLSLSVFTPLSADVPPEKKRIQISLTRQELIAYEYENIVLKTKISSGVFDRKTGPESTMTPSGQYNVMSKMPSKHMGDGNLTSNIEAYELLGVPWVSFFIPETGIAFHGTYWHENFGVPMSHGCINMRTEEAMWLFNWTTPVYQPGKEESIGYGTKVIVS